MSEASDPQATMVLPDRHHPTANNGPGWLQALDRFMGWVIRFADELASAMFIVLVLTTTFTVVIRDSFGLAYAWLDDIIRFLLIWLVYLGVVQLSVHNDHISMDALSSRLPRPARRILHMLIALLGITLGAYSAILGWGFATQSMRLGELSPSGILPAWVGYLSIPIGFSLVALAYARFFIAAGRGKEERKLEGQLPEF